MSNKILMSYLFITTMIMMMNLCAVNGYSTRTNPIKITHKIQRKSTKTESKYMIKNNNNNNRYNNNNNNDNDNNNKIIFKNDVKNDHNNVYLLQSSFLLLSMLIPTVAHATTLEIVDNNSMDFIEHYWRYFLAGGLCASISHGISVPFDVIKTRIQLQKSSSTLKSKSWLDMGKSIIEDEGASMLFQGFGPTISGYFLHGSLKYGFYEVFKPIVSEFLVTSNVQLGSSLSLCIFVISGALAELIGSFLLAPFESLRIRLVAKPDFANGLVSCFTKIVSTEGLIALFLGLPVMLMRNVPYTMVQLSTFELLTKSIYSNIGQIGITAEHVADYKIVITAFAALVAAFFSTIASQPGDTLFAIVNKESRIKVTEPNDETMLQAATDTGLFSILSGSIQDLGLVGLYKGTIARMIHIATMLVIQLVVYDYIKLTLGIIPGYK